LNKNKCIVLLIGLEITKGSGHANVVIINPRNKTISMYEPHGSEGKFVNLMYTKQRTRIVCFLDKYIRSTQAKNNNVFENYMLLTPEYVNLNRDIQAQIEKTEGLCEEFSNYMGVLSAMNPDISIKMLSVYLSSNIQEYAEKYGDKHYLRKFINFKNFRVIIGFITKYFISPEIFEEILSRETSDVTDPLYLMNVIISFLLISYTKLLNKSEGLMFNIRNINDVKLICLVNKERLNEDNINVKIINDTLVKKIGLQFTVKDINNFGKFIKKN
jgi:hypothetical protein